MRYPSARIWVGTFARELLLSNDIKDTALDGLIHSQGLYALALVIGEVSKSSK